MTSGECKSVRRDVEKTGKAGGKDARSVSMAPFLRHSCHHCTGLGECWPVIAMMSTVAS